MKAMILAAGRGKRMGALTNSIPKPLLTVNGQTLLEDKIVKLKGAGVEDIVINVAYLGQQIQTFAGDGHRWGVNIQYSEERKPLETGGGISRALPLLGEDHFLAINADIWCDYPLTQLIAKDWTPEVLGHLVLVDNPPQHQTGDFAINEDGWLLPAENAINTYTFSGVAIYHPNLIKQYPQRREQFPLLEVFQYHMENKKISGEYYSGLWNDIGTPERLSEANQITNV